MAHWREMFKDSDKYLGSVDLWNDQKKSYNQVVVTIDKFFTDEMVGSMGKEKKVFVKLKEFQKPMVANVTNMKRLAKLFDTVDSDVYLGKKVALGVEKVSSPEGKVDALRFSSRPPQVQKEEKQMLPNDALPKAIASIQKGSTTIQNILSKYDVTAEQLLALENAVQNS
jgi:hypothetical protein